MSRRLSRISLALVILMSSQVWALGLGDIRLQSALNEPLRAEIELLSATPDELDNLKIAMASADTFERYGLDRPFYLQDILFQVVRSGRADGNVVEIRSATPMAEPFLTFLVEATWSRGRLLREYTVLLDPPTFAPPAAETAPAVQAPSRATPTDSGQIRRPAPAPQRAAPQPAPTRQAAPAPERSLPEQEPQPMRDESPYDTTTGGAYTVARSETLWGIASRVRPDGRLTMNQTMLAIFEANPAAFGGNINFLRAGASLRIPSADEIIRINRGEALAEAQRQHAIWSGSTAAPAVADTTARPNLTLVPPDEDYSGDTYGADSDTTYDDEPLTREDEIEQRIDELEAADVPQQQSLIEIRDNELAALREELARIRGEIYEPPVDDTVVDDADAVDDADLFADGDVATDDVVADDAAGEPDAAAADAASSDIIRRPTRSEPSLVEKAIAALTSIWAIIIGAIVVVGGLLFWFMRRGRDDDEGTDTWRSLDSDDMGAEEGAATATLRAPVRDDESIMVVEQESGIRPLDDETMDVPAPDFVEAPAEPPVASVEAKDPTGSFDSLEDTFSSETAINLDQSDPIAEADFHMAYGLYDQAADLVNGALEIEPQNQDLLTKLCEIYFVWGNRDAFVDAAGRLNAAVGDGASEDWDKIVIMGQQIAGDDALFAGASAAGATKAVDLSFDAESDETGALDMEFIDDSGSSDIVDLGSGDSESEPAEDDGMDFLFDDDATEVVDEEEATVESSAVAAPDFDLTAEMPSVEETAEMPSPDSTVETPTIEQQFDVLTGTAELPSLEGTTDDAVESADQTAEINLDDLGLDVDSLAETELASFDDLDVTGENPALSDTGINRALDDLADVTGKNPEIDPNDTGMQETLGDETGINEALGDATGISAALDEALLDATGVTQVLSEDFAVETAADAGETLSDEDATMLAPGYGDDDTPEELADDAATLLASLDDDEGEGDFDFAKTEALPKDVFTGNVNLDETGELPAVASTDVDLDLDDLTAALKVSEQAGDTIEQIRDDATVEQPRPAIAPEEEAETLSLGPEDMSEDLHDARTMTEVGTKLDLARAYVDMGDPGGARSILEEVLDEGDEGQRQQAQQLLDSLPS